MFPTIFRNEVILFFVYHFLTTEPWIQSCDPEVCGQQCFSNNYMNAWCENFTCYCDNDCQRHRILYPWDDEARTCAHLCNHKHGPCTGSGCANDTYWANSTWTEHGLHINTSSWLPLTAKVNWRPQYYFFNSSVCFCYDNQTEVQVSTCLHHRVA